MISKRLIPSMPMRHFAPSVESHGAPPSNRSPRSFNWKRETRGREIRNPAKPTRFAHRRIRSLFLPGMKSRTASPASGVSRMMLSKCWSIWLPNDVIAEEHQDPDHHEEGVPLHAPGLQNAHRVGRHLHDE